MTTSLATINNDQYYTDNNVVTQFPLHYDGGSCGKKLPTMRAGLEIRQRKDHTYKIFTYSL